jgi:hypothetical protein
MSDNLARKVRPQHRSVSVSKQVQRLSRHASLLEQDIVDLLRLVKTPDPAWEDLATNVTCIAAQIKSVRHAMTLAMLEVFQRDLDTFPLVVNSDSRAAGAPVGTLLH